MLTPVDVVIDVQRRSTSQSFSFKYNFTILSFKKAQYLTNVFLRFFVLFLIHIIAFH